MCILSPVILFAFIYTALDLRNLNVICTKTNARIVYVKSCTYSADQLLISILVLMVLNNLISGEEFYLQEMTPKKQRVPSAKQKLSVTVPSKQKWQPLVKLRELFSTHDHTPTTSPIDELQKQQAEMGKQIEAQSETQKLLLQQQKEILDLLKIPNFLYVRPSKTTHIKKGYCFAFNSPTQRCQNQDCKFKHTCPTCQKRHPQYRHHSFNQRRQGSVTDSDLSDISDEVVHVYVSLRPYWQKFFLYTYFSGFPDIGYFNFISHF